MLKTIIFIFFNIIYCQSAFNNFISHNLFFLNSPIKKITFDYHSQNIDGLPSASSGAIIIDENNYKIVFDEHIVLFANSIFKRYNKSTNQIFIENSNTMVDSLINNFFNVDYLNEIQLDSQGRILNLPVLLENKAVLYISFSTDSSFIKSLDFIYDSFNLELFNIKYSILDLDSTHVFKIDAPNAFILDLRD